MKPDDVIFGWRLSHDAESGCWIGVCDDLNLSASEGTRQELIVTAAEATMLLLDLLHDDGRLEDFVRRLPVAEPR